MFRLLFFAPLFILDTIVSAILAMIGGLFNPYSKYSTGVLKFWARVALFFAGGKLEIVGLDNIEPDKPYIVVANHQSHMDIPVATATLPIALRIISKKELFKIPFLGWGMRGVGILEIDRSNRKKSIETLQKAEEIVRDNRLSILTFPEGTRSHDGKIHPFKKGPFILAINSGFPILPISISGTRKILPKGKLKMRGGRIKVIIHPSIDVSQKKLSDRHALLEETQQTIEKGFIENYD